MKIIYELNTQDPDQREEILIMAKAEEYHTVLSEIDDKIRSWQRYYHENTLEKADKLLDEVRQMSIDALWEK